MGICFSKMTHSPVAADKWGINRLLEKKRKKATVSFDQIWFFNANNRSIHFKILKIHCSFFVCCMLFQFFFYMFSSIPQQSHGLGRPVWLQIAESAYRFTLGSVAGGEWYVCVLFQACDHVILSHESGTDQQRCSSLFPQVTAAGLSEAFLIFFSPAIRGLVIAQPQPLWLRSVCWTNPCHNVEVLGAVLHSP